MNLLTPHTPDKLEKFRQPGGREQISFTVPAAKAALALGKNSSACNHCPMTGNTGNNDTGRYGPLAIGILFLIHAAPLQAAGPAAAMTNAWQKPDWLAEASVAVKESYDNNVFAAGAKAGDLPTGYSVPPGSAVALRNNSSWVTTVSPKLGVNFAPLLGSNAVFQTLSLAYAPDFVFYHNATSESYHAHRFATLVKGQAEAWSFNVDNSFTYIDGDKYAPTYPGAYLSAHGSAAPRERRKQIQERAAVFIRHDWERWFVRPTAALLYYNLMTVQMNVTGYQNYPSRSDVNGGVDGGCKLTPDFALTLGARYGSQWQQQFAFDPHSSPNDYQRILFGFEGQPWKWLTVKFQAGPDFRQYAGDTATHITPVNDRHPVKYYGEGSLTAAVSDKDAFAFKYKQWQFVSSVGRLPYFESIYDLSYHRKLTRQLGLDLGGRIVKLDYTSSNLAKARQRKDYDYSLTLGLTCDVNRHLSLFANNALELGRNGAEGIPNAATREFNRNIVSLGAVLKF